MKKLNLSEIQNVRIGKHITLEIETKIGSFRPLKR
ncbi:MAG: hypothetical protein H7Y13_01635 [Sphingobacteriaceae bacterium]|nr:hypothetical protein [Sphingobacteriaceae bacterium]